MYGKLIRKVRLRAVLARWTFTLWTSAAGFAVVALLAYAVYDSVKTTQIKDELVQESSLRGQLAEFLLSTREPDGSSLLENPRDFGPSVRPLRVVTLKRPFFGYFLKRSNAKEFGTASLTWEAPRACVVEFSKAQMPPGEPSFSLQACFAALPDDTTGNYIYFSLRYPTNKVRRHVHGQLLEESDHVVIRISGSQETLLNLVFETPQLAKGRYPSQMKRFEKVHEVTAYLSHEGGRASRLVNAQAFEEPGETIAGGTSSFVTIMGRIDSSMLHEPSNTPQPWPTPAVGALKIGVEVFQTATESGGTTSRFAAPVDSRGAAIVSLEEAYIRSVPSRADLVVRSSRGSGELVTIWDSTKAAIEKPLRRDGRAQRIFDWSAQHLISLFGYDVKRIHVQQQHLIAGVSPLSATLEADGIVLPDVVARTLIWLTLALGAVAVLGFFWFRAIRRLQKITSTAYIMTRQPSSGRTLADYEGKRDEIGTLARVLDLLIRRSRMRSANLVKRARKEELARLHALRIAQEHVLARRAIHDAIGHEIRSPLQSLLNRTTEQPELHSLLERMNRAVEALYDASSVEEGIREGYVVVKTLDLAQYMERLTRNLNSTDNPISYIGKESGVMAVFDPIVLDQIVDGLIENACRYRKPATTIRIEVFEEDTNASFAVFNEGSPIAFTDLDSIFTFGVSDSDEQNHSGLGLFAARSRSLAMHGTIRAENRANGVAFIVTLPRVAQVS